MALGGSETDSGLRCCRSGLYDKDDSLSWHRLLLLLALVDDGSCVTVDVLLSMGKPVLLLPRL
jgi:hypothetical protein